MSKEIQGKTNIVLLAEYINTTWEYNFQQLIGATIPDHVNTNKVGSLNDLLTTQKDFMLSLGLAANLEYLEFLNNKHKVCGPLFEKGGMSSYDFYNLLGRIKGQEENVKKLSPSDNQSPQN